MTLFSLLAPTVILLVASITDIKTRKIYNKWIVLAIFIAIINSYMFLGLEGLKQGAVAAGAALVLTLPLVLIGVLGAGDMKLLFAFGLTSTYQATFSIIVFAFIWAAVLGMIMAIIRGRVIDLGTNIVKIVTLKTTKGIETQKIPFSVPILLAWLTFIVIGLKQGAFL